jgi:hypothetical protein
MSRALVKTVGQIQRVQGASVDAQITVPSGSPGFLAGGPTVTITPNFTGLYRVYVDCSLYSNSGDFTAAISGTGSPITWVLAPTSLIQTAAFTCARLEAVVLLQAGVSYFFGVTTASNGGFFLMESGNGPSGMMVEQVLV